MWVQKKKGADPKRIVMASSIPTTEAAWEKRLDRNLRDFAQNQTFAAAADTIRLLNRAVDFSKHAGIRVFMGLESSGVRDIFHDADVVVLISHRQQKEGIELEDGFVSNDAFVERVSPFKEGLDLTCCYSEPLAERIRFSTGAVVVGHRIKVDLRHGVLVYLSAIKEVLAQRLPYMSVVSKIYEEYSAK